MKNDRGVSEVMGFVLTFSLITMTIAIVFTAGFGGLQDVRQAEQVNNVERAFDVLHDNVESLHHEGAPSRATEIKLSGGELKHGERTLMRVESEESEEGRIVLASMRSQPIVYSSRGNTEIAYEAGGVIRANEGSSLMLNDPGFVIADGNDGEIILLPFIDLSSSGSTVASGDQTVLVSAQRTSQSLETHEINFDSEGDYWLVVESDRPDAWKDYFESLSSDSDVINDVTIEGERTVQVELDPDESDQINIVLTEIETRFR